MTGSSFVVGDNTNHRQKQDWYQFLGWGQHQLQAKSSGKWYTGYKDIR